MRISDWSSDVCSSDLEAEARLGLAQAEDVRARRLVAEGVAGRERSDVTTATLREREAQVASARAAQRLAALDLRYGGVERSAGRRVGQEWGRTVSSRGSPDHSKKHGRDDIYQTGATMKRECARKTKT